MYSLPSKKNILSILAKKSWKIVIELSRSALFHIKTKVWLVYILSIVVESVCPLFPLMNWVNDKVRSIDSSLILLYFFETVNFEETDHTIWNHFRQRYTWAIENKKVMSVKNFYNKCHKFLFDIMKYIFLITA